MRTTDEGASAVRELIDFLNNQPPLKPLEWNTELARACKDHVEDVGPKGIAGHDGSDGSVLRDRTSRYGQG